MNKQAKSSKGNLGQGKGVLSTRMIQRFLNMIYNKLKVEGWGLFSKCDYVNCNGQTGQEEKNKQNKKQSY